MDVVKADRRALSVTITRLQKAIATYDVTAPPSLPEILIQEGDIQQAKTKCAALTERASAVAKSDAEFLTEAAEFVVLEDIISKASIKLAELKSTYPTAPPAGGAPTTGADIKLPKIEIPPFKGNTQDWLSFQDLFISSIHNNAKLSGSQKMQYLKGLLQGEPANLIKDIPVTDLNYNQAWDSLKSRYEIKRDIIRSHFDRIISLPNVGQGNPALLRRIADTTNEIDRALSVLKLTPEQKWDSAIIHIMSRKLDTETRVKWEENLTSDEIPTTTKFTEFIITQARATAAGGAKPMPPQNSSSCGNDKKQVHLHTNQNENSDCPKCSEKHPLHRCADFREATLDDRWNLVKGDNLCRICFGNHHTSECSAPFTCKKGCENKHNILLCREHKPKTAPPKKVEHVVQEDDNASETPEENPILKNYFSHTGRKSQVLLATALIYVKDSRNNYQVCRALLDSGSQGSFMTTKCATGLGLKKTNKIVNIMGLGGIDTGTVTKSVNCVFTPIHDKEKNFYVEAFIKPKITEDLPTHQKISS